MTLFYNVPKIKRLPTSDLFKIIHNLFLTKLLFCFSKNFGSLNLHIFFPFCDTILKDYDSAFVKNGISWPSTVVATGNVTRSLVASEESRDEMRRGSRDEWEHVSKGCFCTAEVLTQLHKRLLAPLLRASALLLCSLSIPSTPDPISSASYPPLALSSFAVAATLTTATHHFLAHEPTLARTLSLSVFHLPPLLPPFHLFLSSLPPCFRAPLPRRARHSALFSFYRQQSWLMQYPPPSKKPFLFCV